MSPPDALHQLLALARKDLKAARGVAYPRTHDLSLLLGLIEDYGENVSDLWSLLELNPFAVQFRYELPGEGFPEFEPFARLTEGLLAHVESLVGDA